MNVRRRGQTLAISDTPQNTDLSHISFSHLPVESETYSLWGLHPRNEIRVGLRMQTLYDASALSILLYNYRYIFVLIVKTNSTRMILT